MAWWACVLFSYLIQMKSYCIATCDSVVVAYTQCTLAVSKCYYVIKQLFHWLTDYRELQTVAESHRLCRTLLLHSLSTKCRPNQLDLPTTSSWRGPLAPTGKLFSGQGSDPDPREGAYSAPPDPVAGGEEASFPISKNPTPVVGLLSLWLRPFGLHPSPEIWGLASPNMTA